MTILSMLIATIGVLTILFITVLYSYLKLSKKYSEVVFGMLEMRRELLKQRVEPAAPIKNLGENYYLKIRRRKK